MLSEQNAVATPLIVESEIQKSLRREDSARINEQLRAVLQFQNEMDLDIAAFEATLHTKLSDSLVHVDSMLPDPKDQALYRKCLAVKGQYEDRIDGFNVTAFEDRQDGALLNKHREWQKKLNKHKLGVCSFYTWWVATEGPEPYDTAMSSHHRMFGQYM